MHRAARLATRMPGHALFLHTLPRLRLRAGIVNRVPSQALYILTRQVH